MIKEITKEDTQLIDLLEVIFSDYLKPNEVKNIFEVNIFAKYFIYMEKNTIIGFINYSYIYDRYEIDNIVVASEHRNKKIGSKLLEKVIEQGYKDKVKNITLEVRHDNHSAMYLYEKYGFQKKAIRKNYYHGKDGILMEKEMM